MDYNLHSINLFLTLYDPQPVGTVNVSIYSKSVLFTSISYVQKSFKLNEVKHG